ncbi:hypothetical protein I302_108626 [Kwoniella bestiolae CBS 10118]|uniref:PCI domain-containing protein n=1 Tax=Kwoniella bestiolae CBS 10118 TaxID=1296100 RepID=A0A1B9FTN0_9TREE|nr:hypothetical protein I302_07763 [Kwoniella bestiolae CBS 10118]OCF22121.1 hypothetical protein I302_07763 [Kwoniella bestiolae CBS 10118]
MTQASSSSSSFRRRSIEEMMSPVDVGSFDWNAFEGTYQGRALITRLSFIPLLLLSPSSHPTPQTIALSKAALSRLIPHLKNDTWDHTTYLQSVRLLNDPTSFKRKDEYMDIDESTSGEARDGQLIVDLDEQWIEDVKELEKRENSRLDVELRGYLSNLIKESIRLTYLAFAQLSVKVGNSASAMKNYGAVREYSTSPQHHVDLGVGIVETLLAFNHPSTLPGHVSKLEATLDRLHPPPTTAKNQAEAANVTASDIRERRENELRSLSVRKSVMIRIKIAKGLVALYNKEWSRAARELMGVQEECGGLGVFEGKAISTSDIGLIVTFCTLANGDRDQIRRNLLENPSFKSQIGDSNSWLVDLINAFVDASYGEVMKLLYKSEPILLLNPFLSPHTTTLLDLIQNRCILQYVQPFSTIKIQTMANSFGLTQDQMLGLVEGLVEGRDIRGKIDLIDHVLIMTEPDYRNEMFSNALKVGKKAGEMTQSAILRMKMIEAGIIVDPRPPKSEKSGVDEKGQLLLDEGLGEGLGIDPPTYAA